MGGVFKLIHFLEGRKLLKSDDLLPFFADNAEFIDATGKFMESGEDWEELRGAVRALREAQRHIRYRVNPRRHRRKLQAKSESSR
jgi:hypothetical protein